MNSLAHLVIELAKNRGALLLDSDNGFTLKSGRVSPYFFNAGKLQDGESLNLLGCAYVEAILDQVEQGLRCDVLFGPAYKAIPLATAVAMQLHFRMEGEMENRQFPVVFNRKEPKDHGEGGLLVGADVKDKRVLIVDDVITAGTAAEESVRLITEAGGIPSGLVLILDRQERGKDSPKSAVQEVREKYGFPVFSILTLDDLVRFLQDREVAARQHVVAAMKKYRAEYGVEG